MLMNKNSGPANGEAKLQYGPSGFRVLRAGNHVFCAMSGVPIQLDEPFVVLDWPRAGADAPPPQSPPRTRDVAAVEGGGEAGGGSATPELAGSAVRVPLPPDSPLNI